MLFQSALRLSMFGQLAAMVIFSLTGFLLLTATGLAFAGHLPWLHVDASFAGQPLDWAGQALQVGVTVLFLLLAVYVPTNRHVMMLEASHRDFTVSMDDITNAYKAAHYADKRGVFTMEREFDAVRERFEFLRKHPDLPEIDGDLLTMAAQMSEQSRDLARTFSDEKIARAKESLTQRKKDAEELESRIQVANAASIELRRNIEDVEFAESSLAAQLMRLRDDVVELEKRIGNQNAATTGRHLRSVSDA